MLRRLLQGPPAVRVLMVCSGNICRSPMAEAVLRRKLAAARLDGRVAVDSAGTRAMPRGTPPDPRAIARAAARGYALKGLKSRQVEVEDFERHELILAMDATHLRWLHEQAPAGCRGAIGLLTAGHGDGADVLDPYYQGTAAFDAALDRIEPACDVLVRQFAGLGGPGGPDGAPR